MSTVYSRCHLTKQNCFRLRREFVDNEAELSGSDQGSDDEDERGMDRIELEEGDLDDIDQEEVKT